MTQSDEAKCLRVLQLTDPHLMADPHGELLGINTRDSLDAVIAQVRRERPAPDLVLVTGDLAQDASEEAYQALKTRLSVFDCPVLWMAGNHDDSERLVLMAGPEASRKHLIAGGWQFVLLDSSVPGKVFGYLSEAELAFLEKTLAENEPRPTLVALHHHPVDIGSGWMDNIGLMNRDEFWQVVDRFPHVQAVLWGHVHQVWDEMRNQVRLLATPSTCIQFKGGSDRFAVESLAPGYRWFELSPSGSLSTEVGRVAECSFVPDMDSTGY